MAEKKSDYTSEIIIDATGGILGRIASFAAKKALLRSKVIIVNCDGALLSGRTRMVINEYGHARRRGGTSLNGPHFPKHTEKIMKRTVRGMLSYNQQRGLNALNRVICYPNLPKEFESSKKISLKREISRKTISLSEISKEI